MYPAIYRGLKEGKHTNQHWKFVCPFHDDHSPSMTVNKAGQYAGYFRCWACGEQGSPRSFARKMGLKLNDFPQLDQYHKRKPANRTLCPETLAQLSLQYQQKATQTVLAQLANQLGINPAIFSKFRVGFDGKAYSFPMFGPDMRIIGIRFRTLDGQKYSFKGSRNGLFAPVFDFNPRTPLLITEGESDCMAAFQMGFQAIGRPGNMQCKELVANWMVAHSFRKAVIVSDNDKPGRAGANDLAKYLILEKLFEVKVITPPAHFKDFRQWFNAGAKPCEVSDLIESTDDHIAVEIARFQRRITIRIQG